MLLEILLSLVVLFIAVVFHECAHGWVAYKFGDPTAKEAGRLTLNPLKHIDPIGMIVVPLLLRLLNFRFIIGWAKPVPVNFFNLRNPKRDMIWVALAGPLTNFILALLFSRLLAFTAPDSVRAVLILAVYINLVLGLFNLIPLPPLDGSKVVMGFMPYRLAMSYGRLENFGIIILLVLMNFFQSIKMPGEP